MAGNYRLGFELDKGEIARAKDIMLVLQVKDAVCREVPSRLYLLTSSK
jgi:hypothetical protein